MKKLANILPLQLAGGRLLYYASLDENIPYSGCALMFVGGEELGKVPNIKIAEYTEAEDEKKIMLFYCDEKWNTIGLASYKSSDAAMRRAERMYPGISSYWIKAQ